MVENIPEWIFDLNDSDLKEFMDIGGALNPRCPGLVTPS